MNNTFTYSTRTTVTFGEESYTIVSPSDICPGWWDICMANAVHSEGLYSRRYGSLDWVAVRVPLPPMVLKLQIVVDMYRANDMGLELSEYIKLMDLE